jgi:DNA polymerase III epsilon subunit-like protein
MNHLVPISCIGVGVDRQGTNWLARRWRHAAGRLTTRWPEAILGPAVARGRLRWTVTQKCKDGTVAKKFQHVPELILGFDTETTGLSVTSERAISYGFCAYRFGVPVWSEEFFVIPDCPITSGAQRVHGMSLVDLEAKRATDTVYSVETGLLRAIAILREYHEHGAFIIGSNVSRFDLEMLRRSSISVLGSALNDDFFDLSLLRIIDIVEHDLLIEPSRETRPRRGQDHLCRHYGVVSGGHDALNDARAAVEIFLEQVVHNNAGQATLNLVSDSTSYLESLQ